MNTSILIHLSVCCLTSKKSLRIHRSPWTSPDSDTQRWQQMSRPPLDYECMFQGLNKLHQLYKVKLYIRFLFHSWSLADCEVGNQPRAVPGRPRTGRQATSTPPSLGLRHTGAGFYPVARCFLLKMISSSFKTIIAMFSLLMKIIYAKWRKIRALRKIEKKIKFTITPEITSINMCVYFCLVFSLRICILHGWDKAF